MSYLEVNNNQDLLEVVKNIKAEKKSNNLCFSL